MARRGPALIRGCGGWGMVWPIYSLATDCDVEFSGPGAPPATVILGAGLGAACRDPPEGAGGGRVPAGPG